jgi:hypothetical protein
VHFRNFNNHAAHIQVYFSFVYGSTTVSALQFGESSVAARSADSEYKDLRNAGEVDNGSLRARSFQSLFNYGYGSSSHVNSASHVTYCSKFHTGAALSLSRFANHFKLSDEIFSCNRRTGSNGEISPGDIFPTQALEVSATITSQRWT